MAPHMDGLAASFDSRQMRPPASFLAAGRVALPPGVNPLAFLPPTIADWLSSFLMGVLLMQVSQTRCSLPVSAPTREERNGNNAGMDRSRELTHVCDWLYRC
jgi:hypothetical protein